MMLSISQGTATRHLAILYRAGLVHREQVASRMHLGRLQSCSSGLSAS